MNKKRLTFVWHWDKKMKIGQQGEKIAVEDTLFDAIYLLAQHEDVTILAYSPNGSSEYQDSKQKVHFIFCTSQEELCARLKKLDPDFIFLNHHSRPYDDLLQMAINLRGKTTVYYSSPITLAGIDLLKFKWHHGLRKRPTSPLLRQIDFHLVHHAYQKDQIAEKLRITASRIFVAPKSANPNTFFPIKTEKRWDAIYPGRCTEGYWKRPELAIEATRQLGMTLCMPGAKLKHSYPHVTTPNEWLDAENLNKFYNQSRVLLITSDYREMGPRVIPEAMMCNLPVVCVSDSPACVSHVNQFGGYIARPTVSEIMDKLRIAVHTLPGTREELIRTKQPERIFTNLHTIINQL